MMQSFDLTCVGQSARDIQRRTGNFGAWTTLAMRRRIFILLVFLLAPLGARADRVGYGGRHEVTATEGALTFRHVHDWSAPKVDELFSDLTHHERFFSEANDFAFVEARDGDTVLFRSPAPALTYLWISPDGQFFVGLSRVMLRNPYQLVVWQRDGTVIRREHISAEVARLSPAQRQEFAKRFPQAERFLATRSFTHAGTTYVDYSILGMPNGIGDKAFSYLFSFRAPHPYSDDFSSSVTNWVTWFDEAHPEPGIARDGSALNLSLRSPTGKRMTIPLKK